MTRKGTRTGLRLAVGVACLGMLCTVIGCGGGDDNTGPELPEAVTLSALPEAIQVAEEFGITASVSYSREEAAIDWYVDGVLGGDALSGTITQDNPATFTAPVAVPDGGVVTIKAVLHDDDSISDEAPLEVRFTIRHVDAVEGLDAEGGGSIVAPLRTVSYALGQAAAGDTVQVHAGTYDTGLGEQDEYLVPEGVVLRGEGPDLSILYGGPEGAYLVTLEDGATMEDIALRSGGAGVLGIYAHGASTIRGVRISDQYGWAAIRCADESATLVEDCELVNTGNPTWGRAFELVFGTRAVLRDCDISGWGTGIFVNTDSDPLVENCRITGNQTGIEVYGGDGPPPIGSEPDFGGGARGSLGGNVIQGNSHYGFWLRQQVGDVYAVGNVWDHDPPTYAPPAPADILISNEGNHVILE